MKNRKQFLKMAGLGLAGMAARDNLFDAGANESPQLQYAFTATVTLGGAQDVGNTPHGRRRIIPITGGSFEGPVIKGTVEPGGADWQMVRPDGVAELQAQCTLKADDGVFIYIVNKGFRHGPANVMQRLAKGEDVDPKEYYFRTPAVFETASEKYGYLNSHVYVGSGERKKDKAVIRFYKLL